ncbi:MAG: hypothetical protein AB7F98_18300 [Novosphingobium sp.]
MGLYTGYNGKGLNHVETLYQRGERELAIAFTKMLGCTPIDTPQVNETGSTYICVHPDDEDRDGMNNVLYLSEIRPAQADLEAQLKRAIDADEALGRVVDSYRNKAKTLPYGIPHFGLRFPSFESIEPVLQALENCTAPAMQGRFTVMALRPDDPRALSNDLVQAFVYTDIIASGLFCLGQVIELQAQRAPA